MNVRNKTQLYQWLHLLLIFPSPIALLKEFLEVLGVMCPPKHWLGCFQQRKHTLPPFQVTTGGHSISAANHFLSMSFCLKDSLFKIPLIH